MSLKTVQVASIKGHSLGKICVYMATCLVCLCDVSVTICNIQVKKKTDIESGW